MNTDQVSGKMKEVGGKIQEKFGEAIDSPKQQVKGLQKQVEGKAQEKAGDVKEAIKNVTK